MKWYTFQPEYGTLFNRYIHFLQLTQLLFIKQKTFMTEKQRILQDFIY